MCLLPQWVADRLSDAYTGPSGGYLWPEATDKHFRPVFTAARKVAGLPASFTPHSLRHVFASVALANGVPLTDV
jgi:integrase